MALDYLVDTNILLEILLGQANKERCKKFLQDYSGKCGLTDFSLHSIGVIAFRARKEQIFQSFLQDALFGLDLLSLDKSKYLSLLDARQRFGLDFDDAYQFAVAKALGLALATQDRDSTG